MSPFRIGQHPRELDREEWIAGGGIVDPAQRRPRDRDGKMLPKDRAKRPKRQGSELHDQLVLAGDRHRRVAGVRSAVPLCEQDADAFRGQPTHDVGQEGRRRRIEPLDVVDRDENLIARSARPDQPEHGHGQRTGVRWLVGGLLAKEQDAQQPPLRRRELGLDVIEPGHEITGDTK